jgi:hypothetical protein
MTDTFTVNPENGQNVIIVYRQSEIAVWTVKRTKKAVTIEVAPRK